MRYIDPTGESWYNPFSWDWGDIGDNVVEGLKSVGETILDGLDASPIVTGDISDIYVAYTGTTLFSQDDLSQEDIDLTTSMAMLPFITGGQARTVKNISEGINEAVSSTLKATEKAGKTGNLTNKIKNNWYKSTFNNIKKSFDYHYGKHVVKEGMDKTKRQYVNDALNFFKQNKNLGEGKQLGDGTMGIKIKNGKQGGIYTKDGKPVSFWYK